MKQPIIHKGSRAKGWWTIHYLCNEHIVAEPKKTTNRWNKVTCKNCLKLKPSKKQLQKKKWCGSCK